MWLQRDYTFGGVAKFFRITIGGESLSSYYAINSTLMLHYQYSLRELENMIPWEKDIYLYFIEQHIKEQSEQINNSGQQIIHP